MDFGFGGEGGGGGGAHFSGADPGIVKGGGGGGSSGIFFKKGHLLGIAQINKIFSKGGGPDSLDTPPPPPPPGSAPASARLKCVWARKSLTLDKIIIQFLQLVLCYGVTFSGA